MSDVYHALGLNMHQPLGNLIALHNSPERWEAKRIFWCYDRPTRMLEGYEEVARLHRSPKPATFRSWTRLRWWTCR